MCKLHSHLQRKQRPHHSNISVPRTVVSLPWPLTPMAVHAHSVKALSPFVLFSTACSSCCISASYCWFVLAMPLQLPEAPARMPSSCLQAWGADVGLSVVHVCPPLVHASLNAVACNLHVPARTRKCMHAGEVTSALTCGRLIPRWPHSTVELVPS